MKTKRLNRILSAIILLGGKGLRFSSPNEIPKQLVKLNKHTILMEILLNFKRYGINYFILPLGYKKRYFINFFNSLKNQSKYKIKIIKKYKRYKIEKNKINIYFFDAGIHSTKLNRILKSLNYLKEEHFITTYGDGIANINLKKLSKMYFKNKNKLIITSFKIKSQYGHIAYNKNNIVTNFIEKPIIKSPINIGFYAMSKKIFKLNYKKKMELETDFLPKMCKKKLIKNFIHEGYFYSIDNKKDLVDARKKLK